METTVLKDAIREIEELTRNEAQIHEIGQHSYLFYDGSYREIKPDKAALPSSISFTSLDGIVNVIKSELKTILADTGTGGTLYISVSSPSCVEAFTGLDEFNRRATLYTANQKLSRSWNGQNWFEHEEAMIVLQSQFAQNDGTEYLLDFLSRITDENSVSSDDNGMTQTVQVKKGISLAGREAIRPIVNLKPYRTFLEVEQPSSDFLIRIKDGCQVGIIEADGGMWQFEARRNVKEYLEKAFAEEIEAGSIVVAL